MKVNLSALLLPMLLAVAACAESEPVEATAHQIETAVEEANKLTAAEREDKGAQ